MDDKLSTRHVAVLLPILSFLISAGMIGFAISVYSGDHATAYGIIALVGGHWLGAGSVATGRNLADLASLDRRRETDRSS